ncbi:MAG: hypothetical protein H6978_02880 [Gammaproteobacteria bacterium]|nr:hypothetical protein [Gammaproteobacteria bacterium]
MKTINVLFAVVVLSAALTGSQKVAAQAPQAGVAGYEVEWVYRVRYGFIDEWWDLWRKYEIPVLDRAKERGYILDYRVYHPTQHTDEAARWDYRVEIVYKDFESSSHLGALYDELFPDAATRKSDEKRRWEMTTNHWDLPIYRVDPYSSR